MAGSELARAEPEPEAVWIVRMVGQCGFAAVAGMGGMIPVPWSEIRAWQEATGQFGWWTAEVVREMSEAYVQEYHAASDPARPSPLSEIMDEDARRKVVSEQFKSFVRARK